jgi:hypothetical protein
MDAARFPMRRKLSILIFCLCYFAAEAIFATRASGLLQSAQASSAAAPSSQVKNPTKKKGFEPGIMGELLDEDGTHLGITNFKSPDGPGAAVLYATLDTPAKAHEYFEKQLAKAAKVIDRQNKLYAAKKVVGERAQILLRLDRRTTYPAVLWTNGRTYHEIYSSSLKNILALEKVYRYPSFP